jgi:Flp pilus assembly protein TadD
MELHPEHTGLALGLAALLVNAHRFEEALEIYDGVVLRAPAFAPAHVGRAILLHELGREDDAEAAFARAAAVARDRRPYLRRLQEYRALRRRD